MTIRTFSIDSLKKVKNSVIGNPSAKLQIAQDELFVRSLVDCLNSVTTRFQDLQSSGSTDAIRIETAHVISSLSFGSEEALATLLRCDAPRAFLYAISRFTPSDSVSLRFAFARGLRSVAVSISDIVGPSQWGLRADKSLIRNEAKETLEYLFHIDSLDVYLPLLIDTSPQASTCIAQLLGAAVRTSEHRKAITDWLPPEDRLKEVKTRRGWEKTSTTNANASSRQGGWVARNLTILLLSRDSKLQEASLSALASLAKDNPAVANVLSKPALDHDIRSPLSTILSLTKSKQADVQLAACLCVAHVLRASANVGSYASPLEDTCVRTVMNVVNRILASPTESVQTKTKACFILYYLIADDLHLCHTAYERGCLQALGEIVQSNTPKEAASEWDEDEAESVSCLREGTLTAIAAICLFDNDIRRVATDELQILPYISTSLSHRHAGIRYAACQCVRALSRAVAVLRTNIVDSGLGMVVFRMLKKEDEDRRVLSAALSAVCNIVNEFSPLRPIYLEQGLMPRLVQLLGSGDPTLRLSSLWAVKNLLRKTSTETKRDVMSHLGWKNFAELLSDHDDGVREQAFAVIRNLAENEEGIDMIFRELGATMLLARITAGLGATDEDVLLQATSSLANLANGSEVQQNLILAHPQLLQRLGACLAESKAEIRRPAVQCIHELSRQHPKRRNVMIEAGIVNTLRHLCEWTGVGASASPGGGGISISPGGRGTGQAGGGVYGSWGGSGNASTAGWGHGHYQQHHMSAGDEKDVLDLAKVALNWLEHGDTYISHQADD